MRAANWELLRQKAEENGLYFQPIHFGSREASYVLLWLAREDLAGPHRAFEKQLLQIPSPWNDKRMAGIDYSETWSFDEEGRRVEGDSPGAYQVEVIPLALYSLNHPKAPLLMADFRDQHKVRRSEMRRRVLDDTIGVLSWGFFSSWTFLGPRRAWTMLSGRWGAPINRQARLKAYSNLRSEIARDSSLDPRLRGLIAKSVDHLSINPFERSLAELSKLSSEQYQALSIWAQSPNGLAAKLERDRRAEMTSMAHGKAARGLFTLARIASFNFYRHLEEPTPERIAQLDRRRRIAYHTARLRELLESSPKPEVLASVHDLEQSVETLTLLVEQEPSGAKQVAKLVSQLFRKTSDDGLRRQSMDSLVRMQHDEADKELAKLMSEPAISASLGSAQLRIEDQAAGLEDARNGADAQ
jgi:hypothetical protein